MSETYKIAILEARAKRLGVPGPPKPKRTASEGIKYFVTKTVFRPMQMLFTEPIVAFFDIYTAFTFGLLNAFFTAFPWVFENMYGFNTSMTGLTYLSQAVGTAVGLGMITWVHKSRWSRYHDQIEAEKNSSGFTPEMRLIIAMVGAPLLPIS